MLFHNERGVTLVELLLAIVIMSLIIFPVLTLMNQSSARTVSQGQESQLIFYAQELLEELKGNTSLRESVIQQSSRQLSGYCQIDVGCPLNGGVSSEKADAKFTLTVLNKPYSILEEPYTFYEVTVHMEAVNQGVEIEPISFVTVISP